MGGGLAINGGTEGGRGRDPRNRGGGRSGRKVGALGIDHLLRKLGEGSLAGGGAKRSCGDLFGRHVGDAHKRSTLGQLLLLLHLGRGHPAHS
eukprot:16433565-Heterocapsa_arctica.AAC.1